MIDTVKFKIPVDDKLFKIIKKDSLETRQQDNRMGVTKLHYFNSFVHIPSYFRGIIVYIDDYKENTVFFETSLPKLLWNNNLNLLSINDAVYACDYLYDILNIHYGFFPPVDTWRINRLDLCYAWYLKDQKDVQDIINLIYPYFHTRKKLKYFPNEGIFASSQLGSIKFYNKYLEFKKHDFNDIRKINNDYAYELLKLAENILRFEICLRRRQLKKEFDTGILSIANLFKEDIITKILSQSLAQSMDYKTKFTTQSDNYKKLLVLYAPRKATQLLQFYNTYYSKTPEDKVFLETLQDRSTIFRNKRSIKKAGLGIKADNQRFSYLSLKVPSKNNINNFLKPLDMPQGMASRPL